MNNQNFYVVLPLMGRKNNVIKNSLSMASVVFVKFYFLNRVINTWILILFFSTPKNIRMPEFFNKRNKGNQI